MLTIGDFRSNGTSQGPLCLQVEMVTSSVGYNWPIALFPRGTAGTQGPVPGGQWSTNPWGSLVLPQYLITKWPPAGTPHPCSAPLSAAAPFAAYSEDIWHPWRISIWLIGPVCPRPPLSPFITFSTSRCSFVIRPGQQWCLLSICAVGRIKPTAGVWMRSLPSRLRAACWPACFWCLGLGDIFIRTLFVRILNRCHFNVMRETSGHFSVQRRKSKMGNERWFYLLVKEGGWGGCQMGGIRVGQEWSRVNLGHSRIFYLSSVSSFSFGILTLVTIISSYLLPYSIFLSPVSCCVWEPETAPRSWAP